MRVEVDLIKDDVKKMKRYFYFKYHKAYRMYIVGVLVIWLIWLLPIDDDTTVLKGVITFFLAVLFYFIVVGFFSIMWRFMNRTPRPVEVVGKHVFELREACFFEENAAHSQEIKYSMLAELLEAKEHFFLRTKDARIYLIPKRAFVNHLQQQSFADQLREKIGKDEER